MTCFKCWILIFLKSPTELTIDQLRYSVTNIETVFMIMSPKKHCQRQLVTDIIMARVRLKYNLNLAKDSQLNL